MIELAVCAGLTAYLASRRPLRDLLAVLPLGYRLYLVALAGLILAGQLVGDGKLTWPFPPWQMYTERAAGDPFFHRFQVLRASGRADILSAFGDAPKLSVQMHQRLQKLASQVAATADNPARAAAERTLDDTLRALAQAHGDEVADDPPVAVEIWRATVGLDDGTIHSELTRSVPVR